MLFHIMQRYGTCAGLTGQKLSGLYSRAWPVAQALAGPCLAPGLDRSRTVAVAYALPGYNHGNGQGRCAALWQLHPGACRPSGQVVSWVT